MGISVRVGSTPVAVPHANAGNDEVDPEPGGGGDDGDGKDG